MRKRVIITLATTMTVAGLVTGTGPTHATTKPEAITGKIYFPENFTGPSQTVQSQSGCQPISLGVMGSPARSAENTSKSSAITFYNGSFGLCINVVAVLGPGERDPGYIFATNSRTKLGASGAYSYRVT